MNIPAHGISALAAAATTLALIGTPTVAFAESTPAPSPTAYSGPQADLSIIAMYTEMPVIFDGINSNNGDIRGLKLDFDIDGDGVFELLDQKAPVEHTYDKPGIYTASLRVTDEFDLVSIDTETFEVADVSTIGAPMFPAEGAPGLDGAHLNTSHVHPGGTVQLSVTPFDGVAYAARLTASTKDDPWLAPSLVEFGPFTEEHAKLHVKSSIRPGEYKVLVTTEDMRMVALDLSVDGSSTAAGSAPMALLAAGGGVLLVGALVVIGIVLHRRRSGSRSEMRGA